MKIRVLSLLGLGNRDSSTAFVNYAELWKEGGRGERRCSDPHSFSLFWDLVQGPQVLLNLRTATSGRLPCGSVVFPQGSPLTELEERAVKH